MKSIPCTVIVNSARGYIFAPRNFDSINQAVKWARHEAMGFAWRLFDRQGNLLKRGFCDDPYFAGYRYI